MPVQSPHIPVIPHHMPSPQVTQSPQSPHLQNTVQLLVQSPQVAQSPQSPHLQNTAQLLVQSPQVAQSPFLPPNWAAAGVNTGVMVSQGKFGNRSECY